MDNKNNRLFYWNVKDFLGKKTEITEQKKNSLKDSISNVLNENSIYRQSSFIEESHSTNDVSKYLKFLSGQENKYKPKNVSYAKNSLVNPFSLIEQDESGTTAVNPKNAKRDRLAQLDINPDATADEISGMIAQQEKERPYKPGEQLSARDKALRDLEGKKRGAEQLRTVAAQKQAEQNQAGSPVSTPAPSTGQTPAPTGQTPAPTGQTPAPAGQSPDELKNAAAMYGIKRMADDATNLAFGGGQQSSDQQQSSGQPAQPPTPAQPSPEEDVINKRAAARTKTYQRQRQAEIDAADDNVTFLKNRGPSNNTPEARARHAVALQRAERRAKGLREKEMPTPENIRGEVAREAAAVPAGTPGTIQQGPPAPKPSLGGTTPPTAPGAKPAGTPAPTGAPAPGTRPAPTGAPAPGTRPAPTGAPAPGTRPTPTGTPAPTAPTRVGGPAPTQPPLRGLAQDQRFTFQNPDLSFRFGPPAQQGQQSFNVAGAGTGVGQPPMAGQPSPAPGQFNMPSYQQQMQQMTANAQNFFKQKGRPTGGPAMF